MRNFGVSVILTLLLFALSITQVFAAELGQSLPEPESGWTRYDVVQSENFIVSDGAGLNTDYPNGWNNTLLTFLEADGTVKFKFQGTKIRVISYSSNDRADDASITIDGTTELMPYHYNENTGPKMAFIYEKIGLSDTVHDVVITTGTNARYRLVLDAIDIDEDGELKPYDQTQSLVLDIEPEKEKINLTETVTADLVIDNITEIAAEDIKINYDEEKLEFLGFEEVNGMKLVKSIEKTGIGELRVITASKGEVNIVNAKEILLKLKFKGIKTGEALVDITKGRVTDGIELEKDLTAEECGDATITIEAVTDVNNSGEFTLLDLGIDARHLTKDPSAPELAQYNTDIVVNNAIDEDDLIEIARLMLENSNYTPNN